VWRLPQLGHLTLQSISALKMIVSPEKMVEIWYPRILFKFYGKVKVFMANYKK